MPEKFKFRCPHCYREYTGIDELRGEEFDCLGCGEEMIVPVKAGGNVDLDLTGKKCEVCGTALDVLGDCEACRKKAEAEEAGKQEARPQRKKVVRDPVMNKVMKARRPGMKKVIPSEKEESGPQPKRSSRRRKRK
jgi:hypothetical protein